VRLEITALFVYAGNKSDFLKTRKYDFNNG